MDIILIVFLSLFAIFGILRGWVNEAIKLLGWLIAVYISLGYSDVLMPILPEYMKLEVIAESIVFLISIMTFSLFIMVLGEVDYKGTNLANIILGGIFGLIRGLLFLSCIFRIFEASAMFSEHASMIKLYFYSMPYLDIVSDIFKSR